MNCGQEHAATRATLQMFSQFGSAFNFNDAIVADECLGFAELFRQLSVEVGAVGDENYCRTCELTAAHQHSCEEEHGETLSASCSAEISSAFAVAVCV